MKTNNLPYIADRIKNGTWAINPASLTVLAERVNNKLSAENSIITRIVNEVSKTFAKDNVDNGFQIEKDNSFGIAVINLDGVLVKGVGEEAEADYWICDIDLVSQMLDDAVEDNSVEAILCVFNSPGGDIMGISSLARKIKAIDKIKPVYAWTETYMCSAAYWLGSQCRLIGATPSAKVGNVGAFTLIMDESKALEQAGITVTPIFAGKYKMLGQGYSAPTDEEKAIVQANINEIYSEFTNAIKANRNVSDDALQALVYCGQDALDKNIVDYVGDSLAEWLTVDSIIDNGDTNNKAMKTYSKLPSATVKAEVKPEVKPEVKDETKPEDNKAEVKEDKKEEEMKEVKAEDNVVACPNCHTSFKVQAKEEVTEDRKEEDEKSDKTEDKKEEVKADSPEEKKEPEVKAEVKAEAPMGLFEALGRPPKKVNAFHAAFKAALEDRTTLR